MLVAGGTPDPITEEIPPGELMQPPRLDQEIRLKLVDGVAKQYSLPPLETIHQPLVVSEDV